MADNNDVSLQAEVRTGTGKGEAKRIRRTGRIPAVVYGDRSASVACTVEAKALSTVLHEHGRNTLLVLVLCNGEGKSEDTAIVKDLQHHPVGGHLLHADFYRISLTQKIVVEVRIEPEGIPAGVREESGILEQLLQPRGGVLPARRDSGTHRVRRYGSEYRRLGACFRSERDGQRGHRCRGRPVRVRGGSADRRAGRRGRGRGAGGKRKKCRNPS